MRLLIAALALVFSTNLFAQQTSSPDLPGSLRVEVGFNFLNDHPDDMSTGFWGSKAFNAYYLYAVRLGQSPLSFNPGFGIGTDKFSFEDNVTLSRNADGTVSMVPLDEAQFGDVKRSKLATTYFEVPLEFRFHFNKENFDKSVKLAIGGKVGILMSSHTKVNYDHLGEKQKLKVKDNYNLNRFRYGIQGSLGVAGIAVYFYYGLNDFFEKDEGPEATQASQIQTGVAINIF